MKRGFGFIYARGGVWWVGYSFRGKRRRESTEIPVTADPKRTKAGEFLKRRLGEIGKGRLVGLDAERVTFEDLARLLEQDYIINGNKSLDRAKRSTAHLRAFFETYRALDIPAKVTTYVEKRLGEGKKPATVQLELAALKRMFTLAWRSGIVAERPYIPSLKVRNVRTGFFEEKELRDVVQHLPPEIRPVVEFAYLTGWRRGEILTLTWKQVDLQAQVVRLEVGSTKNSEGRTLPFSKYPSLAALLKGQHEHTKALERATARIIPYVFHREGEPILDFRKAWETACKAAGVPDRLFHDLRRTAVRNLERAGVARSVATRITGHKTEAVYRRYAITSEADLAEAGAKLEQAAENRARGPRTNES